MSFWDVTWARICAIPKEAAPWGRFLSSVLASAWSAAFWMHNIKPTSMGGTGEIIATIGDRPAAVWMTAVAVVPIIGYLCSWTPLRILGAVIGLGTWLPLMVFLILTDHIYHLSFGTCVVGALGCFRADYRLIDFLQRR